MSIRVTRSGAGTLSYPAPAAVATEIPDAHREASEWEVSLEAVVRRHAPPADSKLRRITTARGALITVRPGQRRTVRPSPHRRMSAGQPNLCFRRRARISDKFTAGTFCASVLVYPAAGPGGEHTLSYQGARTCGLPLQSHVMLPARRNLASVRSWRAIARR
jgi:hypothetical protein